MTRLLLEYGLALVFFAVAIESAGVPIPGETAVSAAAIYARPEHRHWSLYAVMAVAAAGAIVGDNVGYGLGRFGGRALIERVGWIHRYADRVLPGAERFFDRHGPKAVFFGRFFSVLRVTAAWLAGITHMPWWKFAFWNAAGGIVWAVGVTLLAYEAGEAVTKAVDRYGLYALLALIPLALVVWLGLRLVRRRVVEDS